MTRMQPLFDTLADIGDAMAAGAQRHTRHAFDQLYAMSRRDFGHHYEAVPPYWRHRDAD